MLACTCFLNQRQMLCKSPKQLRKCRVFYADYLAFVPTVLPVFTIVLLESVCVCVSTTLAARGRSGSDSDSDSQQTSESHKQFRLVVSLWLCLFGFAMELWQKGGRSEREGQRSHQWTDSIPGPHLARFDVACLPELPELPSHAPLSFGQLSV